MTECPKDATEINCGLLAAQWLVDEQEVVVDTFGMHTPGQSKLIVGQRGGFALDALSVRRLYYKGTGYDIAELGCVTCGKYVEIIDEYGDLSAAIVETPAE